MRATITFTIELPDDVTLKQAQEWACYHLLGGSMDGALHDRLGDLTADTMPLVVFDRVRSNAAAAQKDADA